MKGDKKMMIDNSIINEVEDISVRVHNLIILAEQLYITGYSDELEKGGNMGESFWIYHDWIAHNRNMTGAMLNQFDYSLSDIEKRLDNLSVTLSSISETLSSIAAAADVSVKRPGLSESEVR